VGKGKRKGREGPSTAEQPVADKQEDISWHRACSYEANRFMLQLLVEVVVVVVVVVVALVAMFQRSTFDPFLALAQLVSGIAESWVRIPFRPEMFSDFLFRDCLSCVYFHR